VFAIVRGPNRGQAIILGTRDGMAVGIARTASLLFGPRRVSYRFGIAAFALLLSSNSLQNAIAIGETRSISMHHTHTGEDITITFKQNGRYDDEALKKLNWFLRDWRTDEPTKMDPKLFDLLSEVYREVGAEKPIHIISAYRSPKTNNMLRRRSRGVAKTSQHMAGRAIDFVIPDVPLEDQRIAGLRLQHGGVGYYPGGGNNFVHMDTGSVRHWPRMTRDQLARVFPNGRTVHVPSDGQPLSGFTLALADIEKRGGSASEPTLAAAREAGTISAGSEAKSRGLLAKLFGLAAEEDEDAAGRTGSAPATKTAAVPVPRTRPGGSQVAGASSQPATFQVASASSQPVVLPGQPESQTGALLPSADQTIAARGFWQGPSTLNSAGGRPRLVDLPREIAVSDATASVAASGRDRVSGTALAYATPSVLAPAPRAAPMGSFHDRVSPLATEADETGPAEGTTIAVKSDGSPPGMRSRTGKVSVPVKAGQRFDEPWLRAMIVTPSARSFMTSTLFGAQDFRTLKPFLQKPASSLSMTFSADPHRGLVSELFKGEAIVFLATVTFDSQRTAALR
jgi:uncharacterized protein YcbK (DUF882 family)